jgi:DNA polymerase V
MPNVAYLLPKRQHITWHPALAPLEIAVAQPGLYRHARETSHRRPLFGSKIAAGFPSPADDYVEDLLDLERLLIRHPAATFYLRVAGDSMTGAAILSGDLLVVDRAIEPSHGRIVVAALNGELTVKRLHRQAGRVALVPENPAYRSIEIPDEAELVIWGVVTGIVRQL